MWVIKENQNDTQPPTESIEIDLKDNIEDQITALPQNTAEPRSSERNNRGVLPN